MMKKFALTALFIICVLCRPVFGGPETIQFDFGGVSGDLGISPDLSWDMIGRPAYSEMDEARYGLSLGKYLLRDFTIPLTGGGEYRMMLTCSSFDRSHACLVIQLTVVDDSKTPPALIHRVMLGDGYAPEVVTLPDDAHNIMFRAIRAGDNTEANVYAVDPATGKLDDKLAITRRFPEVMKLKVTCRMMPEGIMEAESERPSVRRTIDMSAALEALVEDELYQPDGNPVKALENLRLVRAGWEDERIYREDGETRIDAGMSLATLSQKPVIEVTAVLKQDAGGNWAVSELRFEPFLPYR
ncbi:MAG: hypothetical protein FWE55_01880 [Synergistaceae bacterium]|nr:hypothetical protein [Synergistaceae bacterium]